MTVRAKPVVKRSDRPSMSSRERRTFLTNLGFGLVVASAVLILVGVAVAGWYDDNLAPVAKVGDENISKSEFRTRYAVETFRIDRAISVIQTEFAAGRLTETQKQSQEQFLSQRRQQLPAITVERLIDARIQAGLAAREGVVIGEDAIDARLVEEATTEEQRHAWMIEVAPVISEGASRPTEAQKRAAKQKAEAALKELESGKDWEEVARFVSTAGTAPLGGDIGWITEEGTSLEDAFRAALFALEPGGRTGVLEGTDAAYRIGRVTEIAPERVDPNYQLLIQDAEIPLENYRAVVRADLVREGLEEKVVAELIKPSLNRRVAEIYIQDAGPELPEGAVKVRHILYSPKDDPRGAQQLPEDDPAWKTAEDEAKATHAKLKADISRFDAIARAESDEGIAASSGGKLPYYDPLSQIDPDFAFAIFKPGLEPGQLLDPVKSSFGWHIIQIMYFPPDLDQAKKLKTQLDGGADFERLARDYSEADTAADGGEFGWVARGQLAEGYETAIFAAPVGSITDPAVVEGDGIRIFRILEEATRAPEGEQLDTLRRTAFSKWYGQEKEAVTIERYLQAATSAVG
jgi:parvulin-like peptidyl-prolyl isomerase